MKQAEGNEGTRRGLSRREFVSVLAALAAGGGALGTVFSRYRLTPAQRMEAAEAVAAGVGKLPKRPFGTRMDKMLITPLSICMDSSPEVLQASLDAGMNYIHKAGYWGALPEALREIPRESYYTDITVDSTPRNPDDEEKAYNQVTESLKRNGLKYYDIFRAHFGWQSVDDMRQKRGTYRAFERLKKEGKVKYFGVSQHPYVPYPEIIEAMIEDGEVASIQLFYTYNAPAELDNVLAKAQQAGIGIAAMKVFSGGARAIAGNAEAQQQVGAAGKPGKALLRQVLSRQREDGKPVIDSCFTVLHNFAHFEENAGALSVNAMKADGFKLPA